MHNSQQQGFVLREVWFDWEVWTMQAAPYVAALAPCYAKAPEPPIQLFNSILEVCNMRKHMQHV